MKIILKISKVILIAAFIFVVAPAIIFLALTVDSILPDEIEASLPKYEDKAEYIDGGFGDFTMYTEFYYNEKNIDKFQENKYFKVVKDDDVEFLKGYFDHYQSIVVWSDFYDKYTFNTNQIKPGDYYYIDSLEGEPIGDSEYQKYDNYDVYYVDVEKCILYFIHSNI